MKTDLLNARLLEEETMSSLITAAPGSKQQQSQFQSQKKWLYVDNQLIRDKLDYTESLIILSYKMGYLQRAAGNILIVHFASPRPLYGVISSGDYIKILNTDFDGRYKVESAWKDGGGNLGAIYIKATTKELPGTDTTIQSHAYEGKGFIVRENINRKRVKSYLVDYLYPAQGIYRHVRVYRKLPSKLLGITGSKYEWASNIVTIQDAINNTGKIYIPTSLTIKPEFYNKIIEYPKGELPKPALPTPSPVPVATNDDTQNDLPIKTEIDELPEDLPEEKKILGMRRNVAISWGIVFTLLLAAGIYFIIKYKKQKS